MDTYVTTAVQKAAELGLYVLIEPHYFPGHDNQYVPCDDGQQENFATNPWWTEKLKEFWDYTAPKFAGEPHIIYGVTNDRYLQESVRP